VVGATTILCGAKRAQTIALDLQAAWYQLTSFRLLAAFCGTVLVVSAYYIRLNRHAASLKIRFDERLEERTRLARDLHDKLLQTIQGSKLVADHARDHVDNPHLTVGALDRLSECLERAIAEERDALEALRSSAGEFDSLTAALSRAAEDCSFECELQVYVSTYGMDRELHPIARDEVYGIGYEAIRNACMHSGGTELHIHLHYRRRSLQLDIKDNGRGIDVAFVQSGKIGYFGLSGMRERAWSMGGTLNVVGRPDLGTKVSLRVPSGAVYLNQPWLPHLWITRTLRRVRRLFDFNS
jgi:signal transduction histidine kinase